MNARTTKLIRRYVGVVGGNYRHAKRAWNKIPRNLRYKIRMNMAHTILDLSPEVD